MPQRTRRAKHRPPTWLGFPRPSGARCFAPTGGQGMVAHPWHARGRGSCRGEASPPNHVGVPQAIGGAMLRPYGSQGMVAHPWHARGRGSCRGEASPAGNPLPVGIPRCARNDKRFSTRKAIPPLSHAREGARGGEGQITPYRYHSCGFVGAE